MQRLFFFPLLVVFFLTSTNPVIYSADIPPASKIGSEGEAFRKQRQELEPEKKYLIDYEIKDLPANALEGAAFFVLEIVVDGDANIDPDLMKKILTPYENKEVKLGELKQAAENLTRAIRSKGFVTSRVFVPPQKVAEGKVHFKVVKGKIGKIEVRGNKYFKDRVVTRRLQTKPGEILKYSKLERDLVRLNTHADRKVKAILIPGEASETSDLLLNVKDNFPVHMGYSLDNSGTKLSGRLRHGITVADTNLLGFDDILQAKFLITDGSHFVGVAADYLFPITTKTDITFDYTFVDTRLGGDFNDLKINGKANVWSSTVVQRLWENDAFELSAFAGFDIKEIETTQDSASIATDNLRILRVGPQFTERDSWGRTFFTNEFSVGIPEFLGASDKDDSNVSRKGAGGQFFRSALDFGRLERMPYESFMILRGSAHMTPDKLPASEQMRAGGYDTVRGYPEGDSLGEYGFSASTEMRFPVYFIPKDLKYPHSESSVRDSIQWLGFFDMARIYAKGTPDNSPSNRTLAGVGGGIRFNLFPSSFGRNISLRIDWGYPVGQHPQGEKVCGRMHFSLSVIF